MRKLPEDFRINVLLPGAVWLLASALIGRVAVARMGTDTITVILFAVITLVVFAIPMAVYMEYRRKIEECASRRKPKHTRPVGDCRRADEQTDAALQQPTTLPQDFPDALKGGKTLALLDALRREGFLNGEYRPCKGCNATQMAFIAGSIAVICNISCQWKTFGNYWHLPNLRQLLGAKDRRGSKMEKEDIIIDILKRAAEADGEIRDTDAYRHWLKSVQG
ncbi:hypothetical protein AAAU27_03530 [Bacteroides ovatus]|uniref:hypothetical protein n=1 Tax=Bacteroides ovatus TaxID=28116 RepID=UPI0032C0D13F